MSDYTLYTAPSISGWMVSIMLEEIGADYQPVTLENNATERPRFLHLDPNSQVPSLVDHNADNFVLGEAGTILLYLAEKTGQLLAEESQKRFRTLQWLMFQNSRTRPLLGQARYMQRSEGPGGPEFIESMAHCKHEAARLLEMLEGRLTRRDYLVDEYSIADIACYPFFRSKFWQEVGLEGKPAILRWLRLVEGRPAVQRGLRVPVEAEMLTEADLLLDA